MKEDGIYTTASGEMHVYKPQSGTKPSLVKVIKPDDPKREEKLEIARLWSKGEGAYPYDVESPHDA